MEPVHGAMHRGRGRILQSGASPRAAGWRLLILAGLAALPFSIVSARGLVADDLYCLQEISDPQFSPDGQWIAYTVATPDREADADHDPGRADTDQQQAAAQRRVTREAERDQDDADHGRRDADVRHEVREA